MDKEWQHDALYPGGLGVVAPASCAVAAIPARDARRGRSREETEDPVHGFCRVDPARQRKGEGLACTRVIDLLDPHVGAFTRAGPRG
jgi:hypothetical protein